MLTTFLLCSSEEQGVDEEEEQEEEEEEGITWADLMFFFLSQHSSLIATSRVILLIWKPYTEFARCLFVYRAVSVQEKQNNNVETKHSTESDKIEDISYVYRMTHLISFPVTVLIEVIDQRE